MCYFIFSVEAKFGASLKFPGKTKNRGGKPFAFSLCQFEDSPVVRTSSFSESEVVLQALFWVVSSSWLGVDASGKLTGRELVTELDGREMAQFCEKWEKAASAARRVHSEQLLLAVLASSDQLHLHRDHIFWLLQDTTGQYLKSSMKYVRYLNQASNLVLIMGDLKLKMHSKQSLSIVAKCVLLPWTPPHTLSQHTCSYQAHTFIIPLYLSKGRQLCQGIKENGLKRIIHN